MRVNLSNDRFLSGWQRTLLICDFSQLVTLFTFLRIFGMIFRASNVIGSFFDVAVERYERYSAETDRALVETRKNEIIEGSR